MDVLGTGAPDTQLAQFCWLEMLQYLKYLGPTYLVCYLMWLKLTCTEEPIGVWGFQGVDNLNSPWGQISVEQGRHRPRVRTQAGKFSRGPSVSVTPFTALSYRPCSQFSGEGVHPFPILGCSASGRDPFPPCSCCCQASRRKRCFHTQACCQERLPSCWEFNQTKILL